MIPWIEVHSVEELKQQIENHSVQETEWIVFKHSPRCSISNTVKSRLERHWSSEFNVVPILINVLNAREASQFIEGMSGIKHESPQLLRFKGNEMQHAASHLEVSLN